MKQIKWFRNLFLIGASALMLLSVAACKNKAKKNNDPSEFKVEFSAKNPDGVTVANLAELVVAKNGDKAIKSGDKIAKGTEITFEFVTAKAKGLALKEWTGGVADADKTNKSVKVKIEKDTNIVATLKKALTLVSVKIHSENVQDGKVSVDNENTSVAVANVTELKVAFYGTDKALKDDQAIASGFTVKNTTVNLTAGTEKDVTIEVAEDSGSGRPAGTFLVKVLQRQLVDITEMTVNFNNSDAKVPFGGTGTALAWNTDAVKATKDDLAANAKITKISDIEGLKGKIVTNAGHTPLGEEIDAKDIVVTSIALQGGGTITKIAPTDLAISSSAKDVTIIFEKTAKYNFSPVKLNLKTN